MLPEKAAIQVASAAAGGLAQTLPILIGAGVVGLGALGYAAYKHFNKEAGPAGGIVAGAVLMGDAHDPDAEIKAAALGVACVAAKEKKEKIWYAGRNNTWPDIPHDHCLHCGNKPYIPDPRYAHVPKSQMGDLLAWTPLPSARYGEAEYAADLRKEEAKEGHVDMRAVAQAHIALRRALEKHKECPGDESIEALTVAHKDLEQALVIHHNDQFAKEAGKSKDGDENKKGHGQAVDELDDDAKMALAIAGKLPMANTVGADKGHGTSMEDVDDADIKKALAVAGLLPVAGAKAKDGLGVAKEDVDEEDVRKALAVAGLLPISGFAKAKGDAGHGHATDEVDDDVQRALAITKGLPMSSTVGSRSGHGQAKEDVDATVQRALAIAQGLPLASTVGSGAGHGHTKDELDADVLKALAITGNLPMASNVG